MKVLHPVVDTGKRRAVSHIVHEEHAVNVSVVGSRNGSKYVLPGRIPNLKNR